MDTPVPSLPVGTRDMDQFTHLLPDSQRFEVGRLSPEGVHTKNRMQNIFADTHIYILIANNYEQTKQDLQLSGPLEKYPKNLI